MEKCKSPAALFTREDNIKTVLIFNYILKQVVSMGNKTSSREVNYLTKQKHLVKNKKNIISCQETTQL